MSRLSPRETLAMLVEFATPTWLEGQNEPFSMAYRNFRALNIEDRLLQELFRPTIGPPSDPFHPDPHRGIST